MDMPTAQLTLMLALLSAAATAIPNGHVIGCLKGNVSHTFAFCDHTLSIEARINDLVGRLTIDEKIGLMSADSGTKVSRWFAASEFDLPVHLSRGAAVLVVCDVSPFAWHLERSIYTYSYHDTPLSLSQKFGFYRPFWQGL